MERASRAFRHEDRISLLPESVLHLILSRLKIQEAVTTAELSRRWRRLWASMPYLFFDCTQDDLYDPDCMVESANIFGRFGNDVLLLRDAASDIHTFRLWWQYEEHDPILTTWARHAVKRNIKVFEFKYLHFSDDEDEQYEYEHIELPSCIFTCSSLEELRVEYCSMDTKLGVPEFVNLPHLTKLHLSDMMVTVHSLRKLTLGCSVLEVLEMDRCTLRDPDFQFQKLRRLDIGSCVINGTMIRISAPSLQSLCFTRNTIRKLAVSLENITSLVEASIQVDDNMYPMPLKFISSTKKVFHSLKNLTLIGGNVEDIFRALAKFLQRSPNLELLRLRNHICSPLWIEKSFSTSQGELLIHFQCGAGNDKLFKLVNEFLYSKCNHGGE